MKPNTPVEVKRLPHRIVPNPNRVISRFFDADEAKKKRRINRVLTLSDQEASRLMDELRRDYVDQHSDIERVWSKHFQRVEDFLPAGAAKSTTQQNASCRPVT